MQILLSIIFLLFLLSPCSAREANLIQTARGELQALDISTFKGKKEIDPHARYSFSVDNWQPGEVDSVFSANIFIPLQWLPRETILRIDCADAAYALELNQKEVARISNPRLPQEINLSDYLDQGDNKLTLRLIPSHRTKQIEAWRDTQKTSGSLSGEAESSPIGRTQLLSVGKLNVRDIVPRSKAFGEELSISIAVIVQNHTLRARDAELKYRLISSANEEIRQGSSSLAIAGTSSDSLFINATIPIYNSWTALPADRYTLELQLSDFGRIVESYRVPLAFRSVEHDAKTGDLRLDGKKVELQATRGRRDMGENELRRLRFRGVNTLYIEMGDYPEKLLSLCDSMGFYCIVTAPISSAKMGESRKVGGNASNDPAWEEEYMERIFSTYELSQRHPSLIALALAEDSANGYNLYEAYYRMKKITPLPIIYRDVEGEWNSDKLNLNYKDDYGI